MGDLPQFMSEPDSGMELTPMNQHILIVDDNAAINTSLEILLRQAGYRASSTTSPTKALALLSEKEIDMVVQDMNFSRDTSGEEGIALLREIKKRTPELPVILITAWGSISLAVRGMREGAADFITKPWSNEQLLQTVKTSLGVAEANALRDPQKKLSREEFDRDFDFTNLVGASAQFLKILDIIGRICRTDASVLITGESGTGKELIAEAIHRNSPRKDAPLVKVNLGGIPSTLFESEMFGHVRGAYTDAKSDRKGRFETADGGTIFLDEIGELEPDSQVKLLRVLQDRTYEVLGSSRTRSVDVRVISATNRNLAEMVEHGGFREDLLYRLNLITIHLPALRERREDIPLLANNFLAGIGKIYRRQGMTIENGAISWLLNQPWPGNIRQLRQHIERAVLLTDEKILTRKIFEIAMEMQPEAQREEENIPEPGSMTLDEMEKAMILKALALYEGNVRKVAESLGISRAALYRRFEKYGISP